MFFSNGISKEDFSTLFFLNFVADGGGADDDDDEGRQTLPCEATAFDQTPIADVGKPYRPQPNDSKPTKNGDDLPR